MNAYKVKLQTSTGRSMEVIVLASDSGEAESKALAANKTWDYTYDRFVSAEKIAGEGQYGHPLPLVA